MLGAPPQDETIARMKADIPLPGSPAEFDKLLAEETEKWGKEIRAANIKPE